MRSGVVAVVFAVLLHAAVSLVTRRPGTQRTPTVIRTRPGGRKPTRNTACCKPAIADDRANGRLNGLIMDAAARRIIVSDWIGQGWINVPFGTHDTPASKVFTLRPTRAVLVEAVDLFCVGDVFRIVAEQQGTRARAYEMHTTSVAADGCSLTTPVPDDAFASEQWSRGQFKLPRGSYTLTIYAHSSPYDGGSMAVRARYK